MVILSAVQSILTVFIMVSLGYYLTGRRWFNEDIAELFSKMVIKISLPAFMISNMLSTFDRERLVEFSSGLTIPLVSMVLMFALSIPVVRLMHLPSDRRGIFQSMFALSNTIFIGLPVNVALFGEASIPYVLLYYFVNTTVFWTIGVYEIRQDKHARRGKFYGMDSLKRVLSPPLIAFIFSVLLVFLRVTIPGFFLDAARYMGNLTTPLSMLYIGIVIRSIDVRNIRLERETIVMLAGRFVIAPLLVLALVSFSHIPLLMKKVFVIEAAMPVMTQIAIVAQAFGADHKYATVMAAVSTLASLVFIPLYMILVSML